MKRRLQRTIGDVHFCDLRRPLRIVGTDLDSLERIVFSSGDVASAVHASSAIPGICAPVEWNGATYIDGGVADPLPVDVLAEAGIERIIAVNTIPTPAYLRCCLEMEREQAASRPKESPWKKWLNERVNLLARGNILDNMLRSLNGAQMRVAEESCRLAHLVLRPLTCDGKWHDFIHPGKYIALGRQAAEERLDEIKALVNAQPCTHEDRIAHNTMATLA